MTLRRDLTARYKKRKTYIDLNILNRYNINRMHLFFLLLILVLFMYNKRYFVFAMLTFFSAIFGFYHSKFNRTPIDFKLALFLGIFITRYYGIMFTFIFFIISDIIPALLGGDSINGPDLFFIGWYFIVNTIVLLFPSVPMTTIGPILVVIESIGSIIINTKIGGIPGIMSIWIQIINITARITYFLLFSGLLEIIFRSI
jgi:hypothetical protein